jgi:hypothetical protein
MTPRENLPSAAPTDLPRPPSSLSARAKVALGCYLAVAAGEALGGMVYLLRPRFMPYHAQIAGMAWEAVPSGLQRLLHAFQQGAGIAALSCALALALLALVPLRRGEPWASWASPVAGLSCLGPLVGLVAMLGHETGAAVPLAPLVLGVALLAVGWIVSPKASSRS